MAGKALPLLAGGVGGGVEASSYKTKKSMASSTFLVLASVLRIRVIYPRSEFFPFRIQGQKDSRIRIKECKYFNPIKIVSQLSELWSGLFIPDPRFFIFPVSGSATLLLGFLSFLTYLVTPQNEKYRHIFRQAFEEEEDEDEDDEVLEEDDDDVDDDDEDLDEDDDDDADEYDDEEAEEEIPYRLQDWY